MVLQAGVTFMTPQRARSADPAAEMGCNHTCRCWKGEELGEQPLRREWVGAESTEGTQDYCKTIPGKGSLTESIPASALD